MQGKSLITIGVAVAGVLLASAYYMKNNQGDKAAVTVQKEPAAPAKQESKAETPKATETKKEEPKAEPKKDASPASEVKKEEAPTAKSVEDNDSEPAFKTLAKLDPKTVVAKVDDKKITAAQLLDLIAKAPDNFKRLPLSKVFVPLVERLVHMTAIDIAATKAGLDNDPQVKKAQEEGLKAIKLKHYLDTKIKALIKEEDLKKDYADFMNLYEKEGKKEKEFRLMVVISKDKDSANKILERIKKGEKFEKLAKEESSEQKVRDAGGELGYIRYSQLPEDLKEKVQKAANGVVISTPQELAKDKWAVIKKMDQRDVPPPSFEEVKDQLIQMQTPQKLKTLLDKEVLPSVKVEVIDYKTGKPMDPKEVEKIKAELLAQANAAESESASKHPASK